MRDKHGMSIVRVHLRVGLFFGNSKSGVDK